MTPLMTSQCDLEMPSLNFFINEIKNIFVLTKTNKDIIIELAV